MKRKIIYFTLVLTALLLVGCSSKSTQDVKPSTPETSTPLPPNKTPATQTPSESPEVPNTDTTTGEISKEEAIQIALSHAGLTADQVTIIKSKPDTENGKKCYDIEFYTADKEYDYEIDLYTGEILDYDHDVEDYSLSTETTDVIGISETEAKKIRNRQQEW